jgi:Xaa-Pro dipeptidase
MPDLNIGQIQQAIRDLHLDGWLFYDVWTRDPLAYRVLNLDPSQVTSRRWFYLIPRDGPPIKLVHRIEHQRLASLPGETKTYARWQELHERLKQVLPNHGRVAMQYSPKNDLFAISYVDAGTVELVRSFGTDVVSSADLLQQFVSRFGPTATELHVEASQKLHRIKDDAFELIFESIASGQPTNERGVQDFILGRFATERLTCEGLRPVVAVNSHAADPHFEVMPDSSARIVAGDRILIDLWAKVAEPEGIYADITWCGYAGRSPPQEYAALFAIVVQARNLAKALVMERMTRGEKLFGWEVDDVCRSHIDAAGYGDYFTHRTGHSIDTKVHGSGVNIDNYETKDHRAVIRGSCFSIEPGIYLGDVGVRSEIDILIDEAGSIRVEGGEQDTLILMP